MLNKLKNTYDNLDKKYNIKKYMPVFLYLFFGVTTTIINIVTYALMARVLKIDYVISNFVAWFLAVAIAFITNKLYVFKNGADTKRGRILEVFKFFILRVVTLIIDMIIMYVGISILKLDDILMKCLANVVVIVTNYFFSKYLVFIKKDSNKVYDENIKSISLSFFVFLGVATITIFNDIIIYFFKLDYVVSIIISSVIASLCYILLVKYKKIKIEVNFHFIDILFLGIASVFCILSIVYPDSFWDTRSYHIYISENPFVDKIDFDFFAGRTLNSFLFPLADRMNYIFRYFLGYRLGTIFGYYLLIVLYYQVKRVLKGFFKERISDSKIGLLSAIPVFLYSVLEQTGSYYIDNFSLVVIFEIVYTVFFEKDILKNRFKTYYIALNIGIIIGIKVSNAALLVPLFVYFIIKNFKSLKYLKVWDYIISIILVIIPFFVYAVDNYIQTDNIVYPYYNSIFKSEYFAEISWADTRFGGNTFKEKILWPFYSIMYPERLYDYGKVDPIWHSGYFIIIAYIVIYCIIKIVKIIINKEKIKLLNIKEDKLFTFSLVTLFMYIIWSFALRGYIRYAGIIPICTYIVLINILLLSVEKKNVLIVILISCLLGSSLTFSKESYMANKNSYINYYRNMGKDSANKIYKENFKMLLKDKSLNKLKLEEDAVIGVLSDESASATLLREKNTKIVNLSRAFVTDEKYGANEKIQTLYEENINVDNLYIALNYTSLETKINNLNRFGFKITNVETIGALDSLDIGEMMYIAKIKHLDEDVCNMYKILDVNEIYEVNFNDNDKLNISVAVSPKYLGEQVDKSNVEIYYINENGVETILENVTLNGTCTVNITVDKNESDKIYIRSKDEYRHIVFVS